MTDQALYSGANFTLSILLVRWLSPLEYGTFAVTFAIFVFFAGLHSGLIVEPMTVIGPTQHSERTLQYVLAVVRFHFSAIIPLSSVSAAIGLLMLWFGSPLGTSLLAMSGVTPLILLFLTLRRSYYLVLKPDLPAKGSGLYALTLIISFFVVQKWAWLSSSTSFLVMGFASSVGSAYLWSRLRYQLPDNSTPLEITAQSFLSMHWRFGKWMLGTAILNWSISALYLPVIAVNAGLIQAGAFRAMQVLVLPLQQGMNALGGLALPWASKKFMRQKKTDFRTSIRRMLATMLVVAAVYSFLLVLFGHKIVQLLYGRGNLGAYLFLIPYFAAIALLWVLVHGLGIGLKSQGRFDTVFWAFLGGSLFSAVIGVQLVVAFSTRGAAIASLVANVVTVTGLLCLSRKSSQDC